MADLATPRAPLLRDVSGYACILAAAVAYGTLGSFSELARMNGISSLAFTTGRAGIAALLLTLVVFFRYGRGALRPIRRHWRSRESVMLLVMGVVTGVVNWALVAAIAETSVAVGMLVFYTYPALVVVASATLFGEQLRRVHVAATAIAIGGAALVVGVPSAAPSLLGVGLAILAAASGAAWLLAARHAYGSVQPLAVTSILLIVGTGTLAAAAAVAALSGAPLVADISGTGVALTVTAAVVSEALPMFLFIVGIQRIGAAPAAILANVEPLAGVAFAAVLLNQVPHVLQIGGGLLIVAAAALMAIGMPNATSYHERGGP